MPDSSKWAVLIGINHYHESLGALKYSVSDCRRLASVLTEESAGFSSGNVLVLSDEESQDRRPTYANIHSWLASWLVQPTEDDTVLLFFAGHGREMEGKCYLVPCDATLQTLHVTGIPVPYVQELLSRCKARQKVLILDACHSGAGRDVAAMSTSMIEEISSARGIYTITSCDADELSHEWDEKKQGVFSYYLAEALSGACIPDIQGRITVDHVYDWTHTKVQEWARLHRARQTPKRMFRGTGHIVLNCPAAYTNMDVPLDDHELTELQRIEELVATGDNSQALDYARCACEESPLSYALRKRVRELTEQERARQIAEADQAASRRKAHVEKLHHDALAFERDNDIDKAIACLKQAVDFPEGKHLRVQLESLERRGTALMPARDRARELQRLFDDAETSAKENPEDAAACYERILSIHPGNPRAVKELDRLRDRVTLRQCLDMVKGMHADCQAEVDSTATLIAAVAADKKGYVQVGMQEEAQSAEGESESLLAKQSALNTTLSALTDLLNTVKSSQRLDTAAKKVNDHDSACAILADIASAPNDRSSLLLVRHLYPALFDARRSALAWKEQVVLAFHQCEEAYLAAVDKHKESISEAKKREQERFESRKQNAIRQAQKDFEQRKAQYAAQKAKFDQASVWRRLFMTLPPAPVFAEPQVERDRARKNRAPSRSDFLKLPKPPDDMQLLRPCILDKLPLDIVDRCEEAHPWFKTWRNGKMETPCGSASPPRRAIKAGHRKPTASAVSDAKRRSHPRKQRAITVAFLQFLRKHNDGAAIDDLRCEVSTVADALLRLVGTAESELVIKGLGGFWMNQSHGHIVLETNAEQAGTSPSLLAAIRDQTCWSEARRRRAIQHWTAINNFCTSGKRVRIEGVGIFLYSKRTGGVSLRPPK